MTTLSIITAVKDCARVLPTLISSLEAQTDTAFEWVVCDGASADDTVTVVRGAALKKIVLYSQRDFSIYDALNRGVALATGDYYLVAGADDAFEPDAVANFKAAVGTGQPDVVAAAVEMGGTVMKPMRGASWRHGGNSIVASHAVGTLIRKSLHDRVGYYSNRFPFGADMHFIRRTFATPDTNFQAAAFTAGTFGIGGFTSLDYVGSLSDAFRTQLLFERMPRLQYALYVLRLARAVLFHRKTALRN